MRSTSRKHRITEAIRRAGPDGVSLDDLYGLIYGYDLPPWPAKTVLKAHVWQLRQLGLPIRGRPGGAKEGGYVWGSLTVEASGRPSGGFGGPIGLRSGGGSVQSGLCRVRGSQKAR